VIGLFFLIYANWGLSSLCEVAPVYLSEPYNDAVAGQEKLYPLYNDPVAGFQRLETLAAGCSTGFCLPAYYLAHAQLKYGNREQAAAVFAQLLADKAAWPPVLEEEKIRWNEWLSRQCPQTGMPDSARRELNTFCNSPHQEVSALAKKFRSEVTNPLRMFRFR
jgi:hypothetical protein